MIHPAISVFECLCYTVAALACGIGLAAIWAKNIYRRKLARVHRDCSRAALHLRDRAYEQGYRDGGDAALFLRTHSRN